MPHSAGDKLGPYEILAPIGKGGMGEVYRARDTKLDRDVAIKGSSRRARARSRTARTFRARGESSRVAEPSQHRPDIRRGRVQEPPRAGHGVGSRGDA
jgi:serine/threonine protein kinase